MLQRQLLSTALAVTTAFVAAVMPAVAQTYPTRPITLIVPFPPGGSTTIVARIIGDRLSETIGQPVVIENRGGAGGTVGTRAAAKSAPDGYTILLSYTATMAIGPNIQAAAGYDPRKDFAPIGRIGSTPMVLVVHPSVKANSVADLIKLIKSESKPFQYGSAGVGTVGHLAGELFAHMANVKLAHIPYKGSGPMMTDLLGGHIKMSFTNVPVAHGNVSGGKLRALAVASDKRSGMMPEVPTASESGLAGYEAGLLYGLVAPAGTPKPIVERLNKELAAALATAAVQKRLATEGAVALPSTPEQYAADIDREELAWSKLLKSIGLHVKSK
jgi:tripartite-type tricarboxylate transporter receptor subunit TctC